MTSYNRQGQRYETKSDLARTNRYRTAETTSDLSLRYRRLASSVPSPEFEIGLWAAVLAPLSVSAAIVVAVTPAEWYTTLAAFAAFAAFILAIAWSLWTFWSYYSQPMVERLAAISVEGLLGERLDQYARERERMVVALIKSYFLPSIADYERSIVDARGYSLLALWFEVESKVGRSETDNLAKISTRKRIFDYFSYSCLLSLGSVALMSAASPLRYDLIRALSRSDVSSAIWFAILAVVIVLVTSRLEATRSWRNLFDLKAALVRRHADALAGAYGLPKDLPQDREQSLRLLSLRLLSGTAGAPSTGLAESSDERQLSRLVQESINKVVARKPLVNVSGSLQATRDETTPDVAKIQCTVATGENAYSMATERGGNSFRLTGGIDQETIPIRIVVDAPGLTAEPRRSERTVRSVDDEVTVIVAIEGPNAGSASTWITLYCADKFARAVHLEGADDD